ncbi:AAA family ATPase [Actinomadura kijaniata]|uniref:AAA family ATPase n=1 Tax=Actinomadura kijaniata TaxID=46161 RepID=UPI003F1D8C63
MPDVPPSSASPTTIPGARSGGPDRAPGERWGERLTAARARAFTGRAEYLEMFRTALAGSAGPEATAVLFVHGPGGVGKTTLLRRLAEETRRAGRRAVAVSGRDIAASPARFEAEARAALDDPGAVLLVDDFERCQGLETWLSEDFLPRLPVGTLTVIMGRRAPGTGWSQEPGWAEAMTVVALPNLAAEESRRLLSAAGVPAALHASLVRFTRGHPLALRLAAQVALQNGPGGQEGGAPATWEMDWEMDGASSADVLRQLVDRLVGEVPSAAHRRALEVCAHALTTTQALLRAAMPDQADVLFDWLRRQPYIDAGRHGLYPHDLVRDILDADLRWRDPDGYADMHRLIRAHLVDQAQAATGAQVMPATLALTYLHRRNGFVSRFVTWEETDGVHEDHYRPHDRQDVLRLVADAEGPDSARIAAFWLDRMPTGFRVYRRSATGRPVAVLAWLRLPVPDPHETGFDPVTARAWRHVRERRPLRPGEDIAVARFMVYPDGGGGPSPVMDLMIHRMLAEFIHARRLAWSFVTLTQGPFWRPLMTYIDQRPLASPVVVGGLDHVLYAHDWRVVSVRRWLEVSGMVELAGPAAKPTDRPPAGTVDAGRGGGLTVLTRERFDRAVTEALGCWHRPDRLAANPLVGTRLVADRGGHDPLAALREVLDEALRDLANDPRTAKWHRAVATAYLHGAPTQETAAERLGISLSTYRRHLARGLERLTQRLWELELHGLPAATGTATGTPTGDAVIGTVPTVERSEMTTD